MEKNKEQNIDDLIRDALTKEEARFYDELGEQNLPEMIAGLFHGKMRWWTILSVIVQFVMFGFTIYFGIQFFKAEELREMMIWGAGGMTFFLAMSFMKLFHWLMMDKNAILREIKRLELQVATLAGRLKE